MRAERGWCRLEFVSSRLACRGDIPVMVITSREATPQYFNMCDTMKLFAGNGCFTVSDDKFKVKGVLETMLAAKAKAEFDKGNWGLARGHVLMAAAFLAGLPTEEEAAAHEGRAPRVSELSELETIKSEFMWRDDETEARWLKDTGVTLLHVAAFSNKIAAVKELLATQEGKKMLNIKIGDLMKHDHDLKLYKSQGSALNLQMSAKGLTPLAAAMMSQVATPELIELLIDAGAKPGGHDAFMFAVMQGTVANMAAYTKKLWGDKPGPAPWINKSFMFAMGGTPLHAVGFMTDNAQQKDKMVWLLANGAKPSLKKAWMMGGSPLVALSMNAEADPACFDVLVEAGCDPNEVAKPWRMAKAIAGLLSLFKVLRPKKFSDADSFMMMASGGNPIHFASFIGNVRQLRALSPHTRARARTQKSASFQAHVHVPCSSPAAHRHLTVHSSARPAAAAVPLCACAPFRSRTSENCPSTVQATTGKTALVSCQSPCSRRRCPTRTLPSSSARRSCRRRKS